MKLGFVYWWPGNKGRNWRTRVYTPNTGFDWWEWTWPNPWMALKDLFYRGRSG